MLYIIHTEKVVVCPEEMLLFSSIPFLFLLVALLIPIIFLLRYFTGLGLS